MEKFAFTSFAEADKMSSNLEKEGYSETQTIENVPEGACSANLVLLKTGKSKETKVAPIITVVTFDRKDKAGKVLNLMFTAVSMDVLHVSSGKSFNNLLVKATPELRECISKPENQTKEIILQSVPYTDSQKRERAILKFESISK